ncbi:MAG: hypothetical protein K2H96_01805 [Muribaculaceae bacterium]|nr:hypothetical protein [Muribaculaceae bacterium]
MKKELKTREIRISVNNNLPDGSLFFIDITKWNGGEDFVDAASIIAKLLSPRWCYLYHIQPRRLMLKYYPDYHDVMPILDFINDYNSHPKAPFKISTEGKEWEQCDWTLYSHGERTASLYDVTTPYCTPD